MCKNEYNSSEQMVKQKVILVGDAHTKLYAQMEALSKQLVASQLDQENLIDIQTLRCDFYGEGHENGNCIPKVESVEA